MEGNIQPADELEAERAARAAEEAALAAAQAAPANAGTTADADEPDPKTPYVPWVPIGAHALARVHELLDSIAHRERELVTTIKQLLTAV